MKIKTKRLKEIIQEEYQLHEVRKRRNLREGGMGHDPSRREHMGDAIHDVMWVAVMNYFLEMGFREEQITNLELEVEDQLNDVAVKLSHLVGQFKGFPGHEMSEDSIVNAIAEVLAEEGLGDGDSLGGNYTTGYGGFSGESPDQTVIPGGKK